MKTNKKGISLIVLAITIIVMIILATAIVLSLTNNNIVDSAKEATNANDLANAKQLVMVAEAEWEMEEVEGYTSFVKYAEDKLVEAGFKLSGHGGLHVTEDGGLNVIYVGKDNKQAIIPEGFVVSDLETEDSVTEGLVIYEGADAVSTDADAQTTRNQFVWIPVDDINEFKRVEGYANGTQQTMVLKATVVEPFSNDVVSESSDSTGEHAELKKIRESVEKYGGFYIGRYETGTSVARNSSSPVTDVLVQKSKDVYIHAAWGNDITDIGIEGAVYLSRSLYDTSTVKSTLCYGVEWDAALQFIATKDSGYSMNSAGKGYYAYAEDDNLIEGMKAQPQPTGYYAINNIYDMAGNVGEWTMEVHSNQYRVIRGGYYRNAGVKWPASHRSVGSPGNVYGNTGFRIALYLK